MKQTFWASKFKDKIMPKKPFSLSLFEALNGSPVHWLVFPTNSNSNRFFFSGDFKIEYLDFAEWKTRSNFFEWALFYKHSYELHLGIHASKFFDNCNNFSLYNILLVLNCLMTLQLNTSLKYWSKSLRIVSFWKINVKISLF